jgi:hypothetical protein
LLVPVEEEFPRQFIATPYTNRSALDMLDPDVVTVYELHNEKLPRLARTGSRSNAASASTNECEAPSEC